VPPVDVMIALALIVAVGAMVQGTVGLGLGLVSAPLITLIAPSLMPGTMLWLAAVLPLLTLAREWSDADWRGLGWAFAGRLPATALGAWIVSVVSTRTLGLVVGVMVLAAVVLTARTVRLPMTRTALVGAGVVSGVSGTATSIGGPPLALLYQHAPLAQLRATLGVYFLGGALLSLGALAVVGDLTSAQAWAALWLLPAVVVGFAVSVHVRHRVSGPRVRVAVLTLCASAALILIARTVFG
jgi:uncharacterized protein